MIDPTSSVASLVLNHSAAATVFDRRRIDYCCQGHLPLDRVCADQGFDLHELVDELETATELPDEEADPRTASTSALISRALARQHRALRATLALLEHETATLAHARGAEHPFLRVVAAATAEIASSLLAHLDHEEDQLFPMLMAGPMSVDLRHELARMFDEHREFTAAFARLREAAHDYRAPDPSDRAVQGVLSGLEELERMVMRHHHVENHVLVPRFR